MTKDQILKMTKEELNEAVAKKVMGWRYTHVTDRWTDKKSGKIQCFINGWNPAEKIEDAWRVVLKMVDDGAAPALINDDNNHWTLAFDGMQNVPMGDEPCDIETCFFVEKDLWHEEPGVAICRAALMAVEGG